MLKVLVQGSASPAIEGYAVWGLNPTAGGIKSRRERTGGEFRSAEEGPRFLGGLGEPQTSLRLSSTPGISLILGQETVSRKPHKTPFDLNSQKRPSKSPKMTSSQIPHKTAILGSKRRPFSWEKLLFSSTEPFAWVSIGLSDKKLIISVFPHKLGLFLSK